VAPIPQYTEYHGKVDEERPDTPDAGPGRPVPGSRRPAAFAKFEAMGTFGMLGSVGLSFVLALVIGTALGWWLDKVTGWSPLFFIVFFLLGLVAGIRNVYITTKKYMK
jgi:ATP synthase protein I